MACSCLNGGHNVHVCRRGALHLSHMSWCLVRSCWSSSCAGPNRSASARARSNAASLSCMSKTRCGLWQCSYRLETLLEAACSLRGVVPPADFFKEARRRLLRPHLVPLQGVMDRACAGATRAGAHPQLCPQPLYFCTRCYSVPCETLLDGVRLLDLASNAGVRVSCLLHL